MKDASDPLSGLTPRIIRHAFEKMAKAKAENPELEHKVRGSYLELYNEDIIDLLNPKRTGETLQLREKLDVPWVEGLKQLNLKTEQEAMDLYNKGTIAHLFLNPFFRNSGETHRRY